MRIVARGIVSKEVDGVIKYLLMSSKKDFGEFTGFYYPIGGGVEEGETQEESLVREFKEEINLDVKPKELIATTEADLPNQEVNWWRCQLINDQITIIDTEIKDADFFSRDEILNMDVWPATKKFFEKYIF